MVSKMKKKKCLVGIYNRKTILVFFIAKCTDSQPKCQQWANRGECQKNPHYMNFECAASCNRCGSWPMPVSGPGAGGGGAGGGGAGGGGPASAPMAAGDVAAGGGGAPPAPQSEGAPPATAF